MGKVDDMGKNAVKEAVNLKVKKEITETAKALKEAEEDMAAETKEIKGEEKTAGKIKEELKQVKKKAGSLTKKLEEKIEQVEKEKAADPKGKVDDMGKNAVKE